MFGLVAEGRTDDPADAQTTIDRLVHDLSQDPAWLGSTAGVTADRAVLAAWFGSPPGIPRSAFADGTVRTSDRTSVFLPGDIERAGFVQVVQGRVTDFDEVRPHLQGLEEAFRAHLPCLLGTVTVEHDGGRFTRVLHFSSEDEARASQRARHPEIQRLDEQALRLVIGPLAYLDLRDPRTTTSTGQVRAASSTTAGSNAPPV